MLTSWCAESPARLRRKLFFIDTGLAGGYGGPGHSGGAGDALVRLVNVGNFDAGTEGVPGALCANFYVFDDDQELQECCSCFISADDVLTVSVIANLTANPAFHNAKMSLGAIKVVGSFRNCSFDQASLLNGPLLAEGLKGTMNHAETIASNLPPSFAFVTSTSVDEFKAAPLDLGELRTLVTNCGQLFKQGSGAGICNCGRIGG